MCAVCQCASARVLRQTGRPTPCCRYLLRFKNGMYHVAEDRLISDQDELQQLTSEHSAAAYHDLELDPALLQKGGDFHHGDWFDIVEPATHILNDQGMSDDVQRVCWAMLGKLLYDVGAEFSVDINGQRVRVQDKLEKVAFFEGRAGQASQCW